MKRAAAWLGLHVVVGVVAAIASILGSALVRGQVQPLDDLARAASSAPTRLEGWAALWIDQIPATLVGCALLIVLAALAFRILRLACRANAVTSVGGVAFAALAFALFSLPAPGLPLTVYSFIFTSSSLAALLLLDLLPGRVAGAAYSLFKPLWPLLVTAGLTAVGAACGVLAGAGLERLMLKEKRGECLWPSPSA